jgi:hypothetical protein
MKLSRPLLTILLIAGLVQAQASALSPELDSITSTYDAAMECLYNGAAASIAVFINDVTSCSTTSVRSMWGG